MALRRLGFAIGWVTASTSACRGERPVRHDGEVVVRVPVHTAGDVDALRAIGDVWSEHVDPIDGTVDVRVDAGQVDALPGPHAVVIADVQAAIDASRAAQASPASPPFDDWQPLDAIEDDLYALEARGASAVVHTVGRSVEGRELLALKIARPAPGDADDDGDDRLGILVTGAQHAREWAAASAALWIAHQLVERDGIDPDVTALLDRYRIVVVPVVNPDGYRYTWTTDRLWRKNRRDNGDGSHGVDLNRNWDAAWGGPGGPADTTSDNYRGAAPFSEPETGAISDYVLERPMIGLHLDLHAFGEVALHPFAFTPAPPPDAEALEAAAADAAAAMTAVHGVAFRYGAMNTALYPASGVGIDWSYTARGAYGYLFELRDRGQYGFLLPLDQLVPVAEEAWAGLVALAASPDRPHLALAADDRLVAGAAAVATVDRVVAGADVELYGTTTGPGATVLADGTSLALDQAVLLGVATATGRGRAVVGFVTPGAPGGTLRLQARSGPVVSILAEPGLE